MTPKEKANELVDNFMDYSQYKLNDKHNMSNVYTAKQCAIIAVNELIKYSEEWDDSEYWQQVKLEISKL